MTTTRLLMLCAAALLVGTAPCQNPENPPPWWLVQDNNTVSLAWDFNNGASPFQPTRVVAPAWFAGATLTPTPNVGFIPNLTNHVGVVGFTGIGTDRIDAGVDNDPRPDWIKVFWMQYDAYDSATGTVDGEIVQRLVDYSRHNIHERVRNLGQGWRRVTLWAPLAPQPDDESLLFSLVETAMDSVAIDNLFINTRCIKPKIDQTGDGLGQPTGTRIDVTAITGNADCFGAARTEFMMVERFWVTGRGPAAGQPHLLYSFDRGGALVGTFPQPTNVGQPSQTGMLDLAVVDDPAGPFLYGGQIGPGGVPTLYAFDVVAMVFDPARTVPLVGLPPNTVPRALTFNPDGAVGAGTFWISDLGGAAFEVDFAGNLLRTVNSTATNVAAAAYDRWTGMLYWFGRGGSLDPRNVQVVGTEFSAFDFAPTGVQFYGDLSVPPGPGGEPGGLANGLEFYRDANGEGRFIALADGASDVLSELHAPFRFGYGCTGITGMQGGVPYLGNANWAVTLTGVPGATLAKLNFGFSNTAFRGQNLPFSFASFGLPECALLVSLDLGTGFVPVNAAGNAMISVPVPTLPSFAYVDTFWQWAILGPLTPVGFAMSGGGKTVLY